MNDTFFPDSKKTIAQLRVIGRPQNSSAVTGDFMPALTSIESEAGVPINLLRVGFKNETLINFGDLNSFEHQIVGGLNSVRSLTIGDVGFVPWGKDNKAAIALLAGDSPFIAISTSRGLYALHGGLKCLCPLEEGGVSVFDTAFQHMLNTDNVDREIDVFYGGGIEGCCYGLSEEDLGKYQNAEKLRYSATPEPPQANSYSTAVKGPRAGQGAVNLKSFLKKELWTARQVLIDKGLSVGAFVCESSLCLACAKDEQGNRQYWSHVWDSKLKTEDGKPLTPRNLTVWICERFA